MIRPQVLPIACLAAGLAGSAAAQTGLTFERWNNISTRSILMLQRDGVNVRVPNSSQVVATAEIPANVADNYGGRLRGSVTAPQTGDYTFFVSGDESAELWLSPDESRFSKEMIAFQRFPSAFRQWNRYGTQRSRIIRLEEGQAYYIEAWMKEATGNEHLSVGWHRVAPPQWSAHNWGSGAGTWQELAGGGQSFSVSSGNIAGTSDSASGNFRPWTGDGEFMVLLDELAGGHNGARAGLMLRIDAAANGRHVTICRQVDGQAAFVRRTTVGGTTSTTLRTTPGSYLRMMRTGTRIDTWISEDGRQWIATGNFSFTTLPGTLEVGLVAAAVTNNPASPVSGSFGLLTAQPLVATEVIPGSCLTPNAPDPGDSGDKGLPDAWQLANGLDPAQRFGGHGPFGDPDADNLPNWLEYAWDFDPQDPEQALGVLLRETWVNIPGINKIVDLTNHNRFYETPDEIAFPAGIDLHTGFNMQAYGARYRGMITPHKTGWHRFWVSAADDAEIWLADGTIKPPGESVGRRDRFGKRRIAAATPQYELGRTLRYDFDRFPAQRSERIWLEEGQPYYFEVMHKTRHHDNNHLSVAWQPPGESRHVIPAAAFAHHLPSSLDADDDNLLNSWEIAVGLNPAANGRFDRNQSQYGDPDGDGLTNLQEYQLGTNPFAADTDGDGLSDYAEVFYYGTNPLVADHISPAVVASPPPGHYASSTGAWTLQADGSLVASDCRGEVSYTFSVAEPGVHEVTLTGAAVGELRPTEILPLVFSLNGRPMARRELTSVNGGTGTVRFITPWLAAGTHTLGVLHDNFLVSRRLRIQSVTVTRLGGVDINQNGVPDWVDQVAAPANRLTAIPTASRVSPVSVEGRTGDLPSAWLLRQGPADTEPEAVALEASIDDGFFADVALSPDGPTAITANFQFGLVEETHEVSWIATNLFEHDILHIRLNDSLRLDAWSGTEPSGTFTVTLNGTPLADNQNATVHTAGSPFVATFSSAGTFTLAATHGSETRQVTLHVHGASFGPPISVRAGWPRTWSPPVLGTELVVDPGNTLGWAETTPAGATQRSFRVAVHTAGQRHVITRLPGGIEGAPGAVVARGTVNGFYLAHLNETRDATVETRYEDGTILMRNTVIAVGLPADIRVSFTTNYQGTTFLDGSRTIWLDASSFDSNGIATLWYEWNGIGGLNQLCHFMKLYLVAPPQ